uniref:Ureidopropionase, beta n=1 Tax=Oncorhynchus kisutch TaxID=8019 RepID=A0A8C7N237_ONCKI
MPGSEFESLEKILETHIPDEELKEVKLILFGKETKKFDLPACEVEAALERDFELHGPPRNVLIQNRIVLPTDAPVLVQVREIGEMVDVAAMCGVNIVSFQGCLYISVFCDVYKV